MAGDVLARGTVEWLCDCTAELCGFPCFGFVVPSQSFPQRSKRYACQFHDVIQAVFALRAG